MAIGIPFRNPNIHTSLQCGKTHYFMRREGYAIARIHANKAMVVRKSLFLAEKFCDKCSRYVAEDAHALHIHLRFVTFTTAVSLMQSE